MVGVVCSSVNSVRNLLNTPRKNVTGTMSVPPGGRRIRSLATVVALPTVAALTLSGCADQMLGGDSDLDEDGDGQQVVGVPAEPSDSPAADDVTGSVTDGEEVLGLVRAGVGDAVSADDPAPVAALEQGRLLIGSLHEVASGTADSVDIDPECTTVTGAVEGIVLGCGTTVRILDEEGTETRTLEAPDEVTAVALHPDGSVALTVESDSDLYWFDSDGDEVRSEEMTATGSSMELVGNTRNTGEDGGPEWRAALIDAAQTSVTDIDVADRSRMAALRIGQGVGTTSAGTAADGILVASDARRDQALVYTVTDIIRHTQAVPTGPGAWAVLWDSAREVLWVSTTGDNQLTGYDLTSGTPESIGTVPTGADIRHIIDDGSGDLLLISEDGTRELVLSDDLPRKD